MKVTAILAALLLPLAVVAQEDTTTTTSTTTMTKTVTVSRVVATEVSGDSTATDAASNAEQTGSSDPKDNAAPGLVPMAFAGFAGMVVVSLL